MANTPSSRKRARQNLRRAVVNQARASQLRTAIKNVRSFIATKDLKKAKETLQKAIPIIDRGAKLGLIKDRTASRYISRLTKGVNQIGA